MSGDGAHDVEVRRGRRRLIDMRRRQRHGRKRALERTHGNRPQAVALSHDFALLGEAQYAANRTVGRRLHQKLGGTPTAGRRATAAMKDRERQPAIASGVEQLRLRHLQGPARRGDAAFFVAVRVSQHHLLTVAARREMLPIRGLRVQPAQHRARPLERGDRLE